MSSERSTKETGQGTPIYRDGETPLLNRIFRALRHQRRRYILYYLREHEQASLHELATQLVAWEQNQPVTDVSSATTEQVAADCVHSHFPKLADRNLLSYDSRSRAVCYRSPPPELEKVLDIAAAIEKPR